MLPVELPTFHAVAARQGKGWKLSAASMLAPSEGVAGTLKYIPDAVDRFATEQASEKEPRLDKWRQFVEAGPLHRAPPGLGRDDGQARISAPQR
jgi:hypothetical protein